MDIYLFFRHLTTLWNMYSIYEVNTSSPKISSESSTSATTNHCPLVNYMQIPRNRLTQIHTHSDKTKRQLQVRSSVPAEVTAD